MDEGNENLVYPTLLDFKIPLTCRKMLRHTTAPTRLSRPREVCDSPDQAAHYHTLSPNLETLPLIQHLAGLEVIIVFMYAGYV
jgi:hypothetical protein